MVSCVKAMWNWSDHACSIESGSEGASNCPISMRAWEYKTCHESP
jgi:hypothetical protein